MPTPATRALRGLVVMWGVVLWVRMCLRERVACCAVLCAVCGAGIGYALVRYAMCTALHVCYHARESPLKLLRRSSRYRTATAMCGTGRAMSGTGRAMSGMDVGERLLCYVRYSCIDELYWYGDVRYCRSFVWYWWDWHRVVRYGHGV
eukprot:3366068-Rhodomonas_salina.1